MTTSELFNQISHTQEFKDFPTSRLWKHRHNKGILTIETYEKIFSEFGYELQKNWVKKKS